MLSAQRRTQLDGIVQQMVANKESDQYIQGVVNDFKGKYQGEVFTKQPGVSGALANVGLGAANEIFKTGVGLGQLATRGLSFLSKKNSPAASAYFDKLTQGQEKVKGFFEQATPSLQEPSGKVGGFLGSAAVLSAPEVTQKVAAAKGAIRGLPVIQKAEKLQGVAKPLGYITTKLAQAVPEAGLGALYGGAREGTPEAAKRDALTFGLFSLGGELAGSAAREIRGSLQQNVGRAIGMTGRMSSETALEKVPRATRAFKVIHSLAPEIKVVNEHGVTVPFKPTKATFSETLQALNQSKNLVYDEYSGLAKQAGDAGQAWTASDWYKVIDGLNKYSADSTGPTVGKVSSLTRDIQRNFLKQNSKGAFYFPETEFSRIQRFLERINTDVNPLSNKAAAEVSGEASRLIRQILDDKISTATGEGYQALRTAYSDLLSIEGELVNQFKKAARSQGLSSGAGAVIESMGGLDAIIGFMRGSPEQVGRGIGKTFVGKGLRYFRDPEVNLRKVFQELESVSRPASSASVRAFGGAKPTDAGERILSKSKQLLPGNTLQDVTADGDLFVKGVRLPSKISRGQALTRHDTPEVILARRDAEKLRLSSPNLKIRPESKAAIADRIYGTGAPKKEGRIDILIGPPASGKSTFANGLAKKHGSMIIDSDEIKPLVKRRLFLGGKGANVVHGASSEIGEHHILKRALSNNDNIVLPVVGKTMKSLEGYVNAARKLGYQVHLTHYDLPSGKAAERAVRRFGETGRFVDPKYITNEVMDLPRQNFLQARKNLKGDIASFVMYSNDVPRGASPVLKHESYKAARPFSTTGLKNILQSIKDNGGVTYDAMKQADLGGSSNIAVSIYPERSHIQKASAGVTPDALINFIKKNSDLLSKKNHTIGGWIDSEGNLYLDVTVVVPKSKSAAAVNLGREFNQKSVFDLENFSEIDTGGTGEAISGLRPIDERIKEVLRLSQ